MGSTTAKKRYFLKWNVRGGRRRETRKWKNLRVMRKNLINISIENNNNNSQPLTLTAICSKCSKTMQKKERFSRAWITLSKQINGDADLRINYELSCLLRNAIKHLNLWWHSLWLSAERERPRVEFIRDEIALKRSRRFHDSKAHEGMEKYFNLIEIFA